MRWCQIVMGGRRAAPGLDVEHDARAHARPPHLPEDARVIHLMGESEETRHLVIADRQAVISPSWSLRDGRRYQAFDDMDAAPVTDLR
ncbi:hypothetical protein GCM10023152_17500 [Agromyces bauzanensis]|uniref:Uncharacterized protein n=1 Tax=Agromyces bauzanensis TaxID=1308924 RepID=A0A917UW82_9MICO|nr:hypothetical protein GCM10011372_30480 [Agromyces bauzanensis]